MKDFDQDRAGRGQGDREFKLAGHVMRRRVAVRPDVLARWNSVDPLTPDDEALEIVDQTMEALLEPESVADWRAARSYEDERALSAEDMADAVRWCLEGMAARPTVPSSPSVNGHSATAGTPSMDTSPSPVAS